MQRNSGGRFHATILAKPGHGQVKGPFARIYLDFLKDCFSGGANSDPRCECASWLGFGTGAEVTLGIHSILPSVRPRLSFI